jgi:hypothetical protein
MQHGLMVIRTIKLYVAAEMDGTKMKPASTRRAEKPTLVAGAVQTRSKH